MDEYIESLKAANEQLMTCPFCGSKAHIEEHLSNTYGVICDNENCLAKSDQYYGTMGEAVAAWNTRVADDKPAVRGEWIKCGRDGRPLCSKCGYEPLEITREYIVDGKPHSWDGAYNLSNFCPNCGADMRKEANDGNV